ncbi:aldo/keto reductase [Salinarimonas ramus]|uniref:Oxidoreductase n=1 Tax=Salinarimonas ramus TaxID=690164 RepID=A0A917V8W0_9HYPH|nr:aldo/keto reductase [Salinarimonas ramus]GGK50022.1 oxidoreductase [Salinarimonas ramus]
MVSPHTVSRRALHPNGPTLSRLVWGAWRARDAAALAEPQGLVRMIETCLEHGITSFDHADIYGQYQVEALFGDALRLDPALKGRMEIVTKCDIALVSSARPGNRVKHYDTSAAHIRASVERSLAALGVERIDVLLLHRPDPLMDADEVARTLEILVAEGKIAHAGVSNHTVEQMRLLASRLPFPLVTNQIELSVLHTEPLESGILDHLQAERIAPMIWSPLGGGRLFASPPEGALGRTMAELCEKYSLAGPGPLAIAWLLRLPVRPVPVLGTTSLSRIGELAAADAVEMERQDWFALLEAARGRAVP